MELTGPARVRAMLQDQKHAPSTSLKERRAALDSLFGSYPLPEGTYINQEHVGNLPAEWVHMSDADPDRVILYLHGGAYIRGSFASHRPLAARLSAASRIRALVLSYRLAPEHPFPAALKDAVTAYRWLLASGTQPEHIVLAGDSAGGGLCVSTLLALRDAGHPLPSGAALMSPWLDLAATGESIQTRAEADPWLDSERLQGAGSAYLAGADPRDPLASPLYAHLRGLPPFLIHVGKDEILLDDSTRFAAKAREEDIDVTVRIWDDMWHVFQAFAEVVPQGEESIREIGAFLRKRTGA
ncbi:MAG: alpha/beta hydrolase [Chloroflexota bacterium]